MGTFRGWAVVTAHAKNNVLLAVAPAKEVGEIHK